MDRRSFLQNAGNAVAALVVGQYLPAVMENPAYAAVAVQSLRIRITDAVKEMVTHNAINDARCYFWIFKEERFQADCPGPIIFCTEGDTIQLTLWNDLDEPHAFFIPGVFDSGPIPPGGARSFSFVAPRGGTYLYYDNLNAPVNRVMGLHGAFIVMPAASSGRNPTPYSRTTSPVQRIFDDLGSAPQLPGLAWHQGDRATETPPFRQNVWLLHEASPRLFAEVGSHPPGQNFPAATFVQRFNNDPYADTFNTGRFNRKPHFFTVNGQSGFFVHHNPFIAPFGRVGEPTLIRILNAGLWSHSLHLHANHIYLLALNNVVSGNPLFVDTFTARPGETMDWLIPFVRPPDIPNTRGIGLADPPLIGVNGRPVWPPQEELALSFQPEGIDQKMTLSPLCYPMHDHIETSQIAQGANYTQGMVAGINITGDRTLAGGVVTFPHSSRTLSVNATAPAAPPIVHNHL